MVDRVETQGTIFNVDDIRVNNMLRTLWKLGLLDTEPRLTYVREKMSI